MRYARSIIATIVLVLMVIVTLPAQNMVDNGGFERSKVCPGSFSQRPQDFTAYGWMGTTLSTPDHFHYCSKGDAAVPYNWAGVSEAYEGDGYAGLFIWNPSAPEHEVLQSKLLQPLIKDSTYYIEFHYKLSSYSNYSADRIGVKLSSLVIGQDFSQAADSILHIVKDTAFSRSTGTWEAARFEYRANGTENFIGIGNFFDAATTKTYKLQSRNIIEPMLANAAYYYIDGVIVVPKYRIRSQLASNLMPAFSREHVSENTAYVLKNIQFGSNSAALEGTSFEELNTLAAYLTSNPNLKIEIAGHTDDIGEAAYNKRLSEQRAVAVSDFLSDRGIAADRITVSGLGESQPLIQSQSSDARSLNRRVEVRFLKSM